MFLSAALSPLTCKTEPPPNPSAARCSNPGKANNDKAEGESAPPGKVDVNDHHRREREEGARVDRIKQVHAVVNGEAQGYKGGHEERIADLVGQ